MQGVLYDIKRFAVHDGPGIRTTLFFKGCPLRCVWCHNPEGIDPNPLRSVKKIIINGEVFEELEETGKLYRTDEVMSQLKREGIFMEESGGGVTCSGGEPMMQLDYLEDILISCRTEGYHTAVDTSGFAPWAGFERIMPLTNLFLYDLKHLDSAKHKVFTGVPNTLILENLRKLVANGAEIRIRIPVIPGFNDTKADHYQFANYIEKLGTCISQVDLLPFHAIASHKYQRFGMTNKMKGIPSLREEDLGNLVNYYNSAGLNTSIGG